MRTGEGKHEHNNNILRCLWPEAFTPQTLSLTKSLAPGRSLSDYHIGVRLFGLVATLEHQLYELT